MEILNEVEILKKYSKMLLLSTTDQNLVLAVVIKYEGILWKYTVFSLVVLFHTLFDKEMDKCPYKKLALYLIL